MGEQGWKGLQSAGWEQSWVKPDSDRLGSLLRSFLSCWAGRVCGSHGRLEERYQKQGWADPHSLSRIHGEHPWLSRVAPLLALPLGGRSQFCWTLAL